MENIKNVPKKDLCNYCGTCAGMCPEDAIYMKEGRGVYIPEIDESKCINCGTCIRVCPGISFDINVFCDASVDIRRDGEIGNFINTYVSFSKNNEIRKSANSGGLVTTFLLYLLENKMIDGAVVTIWNEKNPLRPKTIIARTKEDILQSQKSKYCPVPTNIILKEIRKEEGKFAFVGVGCQIQGLRKAMSEDGNIKNKIVFCLGLICEGTLNFNFQERILKRAGLKREEIIQFNYKDKTWRDRWPGDIRIKVKNNEIINLDNSERFSVKKFFHPWRCYLCFDILNESSDITFGDAWLQEYMRKNKGHSMVITRHEVMDNLIKEIKKEDLIDLHFIEPAQIIQAQAPRRKRELLFTYLKINRFLGKGVPKYNTPTLNKYKEAKNTKLVSGLVDFVISKSSVNFLTRPLILRLPTIFLKIVNYLNKRYLN
jgi:coenzyme F420 hydrogenase subunit beta